MLEETDQSLGSIIDALEETGQFDNTYVVFTSDNGGDFYKSNANHLRFNGPLQGRQGFDLRRWNSRPVCGVRPGNQARIGSAHVPVIQWDLLPTLHDLAGSQAPLPAGVDGGSLRDVFESGDAGSVRQSCHLD